MRQSQVNQVLSVWLETIWPAFLLYKLPQTEDGPLVHLFWVWVGFDQNLQEQIETVVPSPEISYLWLGEATIGCPTLFFALVSWGGGISPLRAGSEGSRLAYKRASQHTVATTSLKGLKTSIILLIVKCFYTKHYLNKWVLDDTVLFLERSVILGLELCLSRMFLNDWRAHYRSCKVFFFLH